MQSAPLVPFKTLLLELPTMTLRPEAMQNATGSVAAGAAAAVLVNALTDVLMFSSNKEASSGEHPRIASPAVAANNDEYNDSPAPRAMCLILLASVPAV